MSCYIRPHVADATIFFTVALAQRGDSLLVDEVERLRVAVRQTMVERPFFVAAWVVLPDHMHAIWTLPQGDSDYSMRWAAIKERFAMFVRAAGNEDECPIWEQGILKHIVRDAREYEAIRRYCWHNPVKHGLAARPQDWPYSSVHRDMRPLGGAAPAAIEATA